MKLHADFGQRVVVRPDDHEWVASPTPGVTRMMLDRVGDEVARATSLVRYVPDSAFPAHEHGGGEEILVLEGEFADDHGAYPAGAYLRNPVGTRHAPRVGPAGALIFVKLHQFDVADQRQVALDTHAPAWLTGPSGVRIQALHEFRGESIALQAWPPGLRAAPRSFPAGAELLVLRGSLQADDDRLPAGSWLRLPAGATALLATGDEEALVYVKTGHLTPPRLPQ